MDPRQQSPAHKWERTTMKTYGGEVDQHDMFRQLYLYLYGADRKRTRWHIICFGLLDMRIVNAYVMYKVNNASLPVMEF